MLLDKKTLKQYRALKKELDMLDRKLDRLYARQEDIPVVKGKVTASSRDFPYIEEHITVMMDEPKQADVISKQIRINQERREECMKLRLQIEQFIDGIPDSTTRQIFEMVYLEGKKQREVAELVCLDRSRISRKIDAYLKNAHKAQK